MSRIASKNTKPELIVRSLVYGLGLRFRLHVKDLPGRPDLVFRGRKKIILVHGCFWHQHSDCREGRLPGSRQEYWGPKLMKNVERDARHAAELTTRGWKTLVIWECEIGDQKALKKRLLKFLSN